MPATNSDRIVDANARLFADADLDAVEEYFDANYVLHLGGDDLSVGHDGVRRALGALQKAFGDLSVEVEVLVEADDRIAWQRTITGRHRKAFRGFPASGTDVVWRDQLTTRFHEGRIAEEWAVSDLAEQLLAARK